MPLRATGASSERHCVRDLAFFAHRCGATPIPALSGRTDRHRINRGGDSNASSVLHRSGLHAVRPTNPGRRRQTHHRGHVSQEHHAVPQAVRHPRDL
ncbi:transposase [Streptomyces sp. NPDC048215]|uniref:transposase n=1 Tax=Streptomyces TaxID=1883 RepID=UPI002E0F3283|nr:transposase [[Kitasatospora] papulosa]WSK32444.1 transposase [[Kitasatospora] papulosa]